MAPLALGVALVLVAASSARAVTTREILDHVDDLFRGTSAHGRATMTVTTARARRASR